MSKEKDIFRNVQAEFSLEVLQKYLAGTLSPAETRLIERAMVDDPFLADAVEGLSMQNPAVSKRIVNELNNEILSSPKTKERPLWVPLSVAASIVIAFFIIYFSLPASVSKMESSVEVQDTVSNAITASSIEPSQDSTKLPETISDVKINGPLAFQNEPCPPTPSKARENAEELVISSLEEENNSPVKPSESQQSASGDFAIDNEEDIADKLSLSMSAKAKDDNISGEVNLINDMIEIAEENIGKISVKRETLKEITKNANIENKKKDCKNCPDVNASYKDAAERQSLTRELAIKKYKNDQFAESKAIFEKLLKENPQDHMVEGYLVLCDFQLTKYTLLKTKNNRTGIITELEDWLNTITLINQNKQNEARLKLNEIIQQNGAYAIQAKEILSKLE